MSKKFVLVSLIAVLLGLLALPILAQEEGDVVLRWRTRPDNDAEIQVYTAASETIDAAWDGVSLQYEPGGSETASYQDILIAEIDADTAPDVFWIPGTDVARFAEAGLILNLAEYAAAIRALGDDVYGFGMNAWWANPGYFINAAGSSFFTEDFKACGLNNDATVEALTFARSLYADDLAIPYGTDSEPPFLSGNVGMFMNGRWATPGVIANATFNWNVAPLPDGPAGPSNWLFWGAYVVNAKTDYPEEAWELVTRLTSAEIQGSIAALGANIPSRQTEDAIELFLNTLPDSGVNNQAFVDGAAAGVAEAPLFFGDWPQIDAVYGAGFTAVLNGELEPQDFANTVCEQVVEFFDAE